MPEKDLQSLLAEGRLPEAESLCRDILSERPDDQATLYSLASAYFQNNYFREALHFFEKMIDLDPNDYQAHFNKAITLKVTNNLCEAERGLRRTTELNPAFTLAILELAETLKDQGKLDESISAYREALEQDPKCAIAHYSISNLVKHKTYDQDMSEMERLYAVQGSDDQDRIYLGFALGKAFEELGRYDEAFSYIEKSNKLKRAGYTFDIANTQNLFNRIKQTFSAEFLRRHGNAGIEDKTPVFVVGMVRSGTSLVEQILSSHSQIHGAGELQYLDRVCMQAARDTGAPVPECFTRFETNDFNRYSDFYLNQVREHSEAPYIVDKMPFNFRHLGLISVLFRKAKIIHIHRNPLDTCWSIYKNYFGGAHYFVDDQTDLGRYYSLYSDLMTHWTDILQDRIISVEYESLVADPEKVIRNMLDSCEIPFESSCLKFHDTARNVRTLSTAQVQRPIYNDSVLLADKYGDKLDPLRTALGLI